MKNAAGHSAKLGALFLHVLGLDPLIWTVTRIVIEVGEAPYIELRRRLNELEGEEIATRLRRVGFSDEEPA